MFKEYSLHRENVKKYILDNIDEVIDHATWHLETEEMEKLSGNKLVQLVTSVDLNLILRGDEWLLEGK